MNRSCNSILCRFGIHTADPYVHIQVKCRNGSHRWQSNYEVCKRCGKRLAAVCGYSEIGRVVDKLTREKMISLHDFERKEKHYE